MKTLSLIFLTIAIFCNCSFAITPPKLVKVAFEKKFPTATNITWEKEAAKEWEADFNLNGNKVSANFYEDGTWLETEMKIKVSSLSPAIATAIKKTYPGWTIAEVDKAETSKHGTIYEADLKKGMKKKSIAFKEDGTPVNE